jgi:hypothetical protein
VPSPIGLAGTVDARRQPPVSGAGPVKAGDAVEVHSSFEDTWAAGFEVVEVVDGGFTLRRLSDGRLLPSPTGPDDVRPASTSRWSQRQLSD